MDRTEIAALAETVVPFVRETVAESVAALIARISELEKTAPVQGPQGERGPQGPPGEVPALPLELAEQVASAVRLLHESPSQQRASPKPARVTRIERDEQGNLVPVYE